MLKVETFKSILLGDKPKVALFVVVEGGYQSEIEWSPSEFLEIVGTPCEDLKDESKSEQDLLFQIGDTFEQLSLILDNEDGGQIQIEILDDSKAREEFVETLKSALA